MAWNYIHSALDVIRDKYTPVTHTSTFRSTGQITPEEFLLAGDFLVYKFPSWSWSDASSPAKRVPHLPAGKQFLVTRGVPCRRRLDADFAGDAGGESVVRDGFAGDGGEDDAVGEKGEGGKDGPGGGEDDGWLRTGGMMAASQEARVREVRTVDESGEVREMDEEEEEEEIPDMEDEEDDEEAIIREPGAGEKENGYVLLFISM